MHTAHIHTTKYSCEIGEERPPKRSHQWGGGSRSPPKSATKTSPNSQQMTKHIEKAQNTVASLGKKAHQKESPMKRPAAFQGRHQDLPKLTTNANIYRK